MRYQPTAVLKDGARCRVRTDCTPPDYQGLTKVGTEKWTKPLSEGFEICEVFAIWPDLPDAFRAAILAIVRSYRKDLSINRENESASEAKVAPARAAQRKSSGAGAKPELPVCGQVDRDPQKNSPVTIPCRVENQNNQ